MESGPPFLRGDCNDDGNVDNSDGVCILNWLFLGADNPSCMAALDTDGIGVIDLNDGVRIFNHLFLGGPQPVDPFPACGPGELPTDETLGCITPPKCP